MLLSISVFAQKKVDRPKLVIGIMIDQMRYDYLYRYYSKYSAGGFKRILTKGASCENTFIPFIPTYTAPGHACAYTGSVPAINGIIGNDWYDRTQSKEVYCTADEKVNSVGANGKVGQHSPKNLWSTSITDELRLAQNFKNKTISIAIKDRASILPGGHSANAAYWLDAKAGNFISSSYYMPSLPNWVNQFNAKKLPDSLLKNNWQTVLDKYQYIESTEDDKWYEKNFSNEKNSAFPHNVYEMTKDGYDVIRSTPFGNTLTIEFAKQAIEGEQLGAGNYTDFLAVSFSSTDIIGHQFGPNSIEVEDTYLRLDKDLENFFNFLDKKIGKGKYLLFISADHGAAHAKGFSQEHNIPSDVFFHDKIKNEINKNLSTKFGAEFQIADAINMQFYMNDAIKNSDRTKQSEIKSFIKKELLQHEMILKVVDLEYIGNENISEYERKLLTNGYLQKRSGDIQAIFKSAILEEFSQGTTHGSGYSYDTRIPLLWYGWKIKPGEIHSRTEMTDIAPTLANLLHIQEPSGTTGKPILELMK
jgi:predicted AlkP superfamily pyrophosphatase or phosphodiesterase